METEKFELMLDEAQANAALEKGMLYADTFVNKNYLINLDRYPLVELDSAEKSDEYIRLYQIERIVYDVDENANDKLISVYSAFFNIQAAGLLVIKSTRNSSDSKGDYTGALVTRVKSLTNGISGQVLCSVNDIDEEYLFDQNTIVDLSRVSSLETKSLLMGVLILKLNEYRMCTSEENQPLRHVTVMEEAHNILKRSPTGGSEGSNVQAKSVEMISSAIAEMRTYGEGFIIVDQSPTAVDVSAVKNTNTKIIMRLPDYEDCKIAGLSMGLNDSQIREISRFPMGVAVVYQNNWVEAVLTQIDKSEEQYHQTDLITDDYALAVIKGQLAVELIFQYETGLAADEGFQLDDLLEVINNSDINASKKQDIVQSMVDWCSCFEREAPVNGTFAAKLAEFISCNGLFEALPIRFAKAQLESMLYNSLQMEEEFITFRVVRGSILEREINGCLTDCIQKAANRCKYISVPTFRYGGVPEQLTFFVQPDYCYR